MEWYLKCLKEKYANFDGRARRTEYWMYTLFNLIVLTVLYVLMFVFLSFSSTLGMIVSLLVLVYVLATLIPTIAVGVRRLHDTNKSGWFLLLALIPVGNIVVLIFMCLDSTPGDNQYGPSPK